LHQHGIEKVDGVVFDLGISSYQIDDPDRGFSLRFNGPLSMQMGHNHISAYDVVNSFSEKEIDNILYEGEERNSRRIAHAIIKKRAEGPIQTTKELADLIKSIIPAPKDAQHPATLTFQAIRMFVNNELEEIKQALNYCKDILNPDGRLIVVTFHSLEDRIVKNFFKDITGNAPSPSRYVPLPPQKKVSFKLMTPQPITPTLDEVQQNPRSRSAKLRYIRRLYEFEEK
jgi:16S rRNA (cytosine1402-N4)-methyltransferase